MGIDLSEYLNMMHKQGHYKLQLFMILFDGSCRKNLNTKLYANSLVGVGVASALYHSSRGKLRRFFRWADYTMIATTAVVSIRWAGFLKYQSSKFRRKELWCLPCFPLIEVID